jgi:hypothetical protein
MGWVDRELFGNPVVTFGLVINGLPPVLICSIIGSQFRAVGSVVQLYFFSPVSQFNSGVMGDTAFPPTGLVTRSCFLHFECAHSEA